MSDTAIRAEGIGKRYRLGAQERYRTLRDTLTDAFTYPVRRLRSRHSLAKEPEPFWALRDVSFEVKHGEVIGVIGRNGAGKSTLLKVLSRITEPTEGQTAIHGRISSLLEVGTGFHPELTGRENIFLNGAILGMRKADIRKNFDEIVAFAEVAKFVDTPVKHYSSGMYVRLAFAVAAHLETDILVVDEVLAVGDAAFQKKCLGKMGDVARAGRTVLLVSHSMASISSLCTAAMFIEAGRLAFFGPTDQAVDRYLEGVTESQAMTDLSHDKERRRGTGELRFVSARMLDDNGTPANHFAHEDNISIELTLEGKTSYGNFNAVVFVRTTTGINVLHVPTPPGFPWPSIDGRVTVVCKLPRCRLYPGTYVISLWIGRKHLEIDNVPDVLLFSVEQGTLTRYGFDMSWTLGLYFCDCDWSLTPDSTTVEASPLVSK